jgi:glyoxylase-like metal-dependent hydrolase (beta-lactamase superfamily II)
MPVELYAVTCGYITIPSAFLLSKTRGWLTVPVPAYVILHPKGRVVFDSGMHLRTQTDPLGYFGKEGFKANKPSFSPGEEISARLAALQIAPEEITHLINSHLHYDHAGGNAQLPNAEIVLQRREWDHAMAMPDDDVAYHKTDFDTGQHVYKLSGEHDLFGDGTVVCLPTYGHTPGHQSLRVKTAAGEFVLCGDACYLKQSLDNLHLPGIIADKEAALAVFQRFREMQSRGARIMFGHDPEFWRDVPQAPARLG